MEAAERRALTRLRFNWAPTPDSVWKAPPFHVDGLHADALQTILAGVDDAAASDGECPIGVALVGQRGVGKTHLLTVVRERVQAAGGYFFLISLYDPAAFWRNAVLSMMDGLVRSTPGRDSQLVVFLTRLAEHLGTPRSIRRIVVGEVPPTRAALDAFVDLLRRADRQAGIECGDTARALVLLGSPEAVSLDVGHAYLLSNDEEEPGERAEWGISRARQAPQDIARQMSRLLALTGPTVIAVDQLDLLVAQARLRGEGELAAPWAEILLLDQIGSGLMSLREMTKRTLSVVSLLPSTWRDIQHKATDTVQDRFRETHLRGVVGSPALARAIVAGHLGVAYRSTNFVPPAPTWPVADDAFEQAVDFTPRELLIAIDRHVRSCLNEDVLTPLENFGQPVAGNPAGNQVEQVPGTTLDALDARFAELLATGDPGPALDATTEDAVVPGLLQAGLTAWIAEQRAASRSFSLEPLPGPKPALHAKLLRSLDESREDEAHWCFRAIIASHAIAVQNRLQNAMTAAGLTEGVTKRKLFILRSTAWPNGPRTAEMVETFETAGGRLLDFSPDDVRILVALRDLFEEAEDRETVAAWCADRRPTTRIAFLAAALANSEEPAPIVEPPSSISGESIVVGTRVIDGRPVPVELMALRRHTAIFAGSGSGKTVFIRRLVEECALQGVSSIVLDPNNDLARLGDPWPTTPSTWDEHEILRAKEYLDHTEVKVWTPRREAGRPLAFQPLPDFGGILDDRDEFGIAVDAGVAALAPRAKVDGAGNKAHLGQAVLREALSAFARERRHGLSDFIDFLASLPPGVSRLQNAVKIASDMSQSLAAAMVNDPLFGGEGVPMDPGVLLTPGPGKRARVSVISFIGLPTEEQRQSFVNQLQLALFAWLRRNPAGDRPLGGLFVMDEAQTLAPSGGVTACTQSTLALAAQARKYGLGLVFATQAPRALHNSIPGNASTQLVGLLNSPVQIAAAREIARAKGGDVPEIARLGTGEFYAAIAGGAFERIRTPLCLSYHPASPLTVEEVLDRTRDEDDR